MTDPAGGVYSYTYDTKNNINSVAYPDHKTRTYLYENPSFPNALTAIVDENGARFAGWTYDIQGRATSSEHAEGAEKVTLTYNSDGTTTELDAFGTLHTYSFSTLLGVVKSRAITGPACPSCGSAGTTYDANGFIASRTDWNGNVTNYLHDARGLETSRTEAFGTAQTRTISTTWHTTFRLPTQIVEKDASGTVLRATDLTYDAAGNLLQKSVTDTATNRTRTWSYTYNANGQVLTADGPRTDVPDVTTYTYYATNDPDLGKRGNVATVTNALGHVTSITAYDAHGRPVTIVDPNGLATQLGYDPRGRLTSRSVGGETTTYGYDGVGQLTQVTLPDGSFLSYTYDAAHRLTAITDSLSNRIAYTLDAMGNRVKEDVRDPTGALAQTRSRVYSNLNRLAQEIGAQNQTTQYSYDNQGNVTSVTDPLNHLTANAYDALNRLIRVTDPALGQTQYGYNALDQLTSVTDPRSLVTRYAYDGLSNLNQQASPDTGVTRNTYDAAGNLLTQLDAKGQTTSYGYDALNRVTRIAYADGQLTTFQYDQGINGIGRLTSVTDSTGATAYAYDPKGRLLTETRAIAGLTYTTAYGYDTAGRLTRITYPSGRQVAYTLDSLGRIATLTTTANGRTDAVVTAVAYRPFGGVASLTYGNGETYTRAFDQDGRINAYTLATQTKAVGYDAASRIGFLSNAQNPADTTTYGYDALDRLTSAVTPFSNFGFSYDAVGNRTTKTVGAASDTYAYSATSNRLASITNAAGARRNYLHDLNGAIVNDGVNQYAYDARGRLVQATTGQGASSYQVNALGQRIRKSTSAEERVFLYDTHGQLIAETSPTGTTLREYLYLNDIPIAVIQ